jgi:hypothetical protein
LILLSRHLASHQCAWQFTKGKEGLLNINAPIHRLKWSILATAGATSWIHIDANGLATLIYMSAGRKYWLVGKQKREWYGKKNLGDIGAMEAFGKDWAPDGDGIENFEWEGVLLEPGHSL